MGIESKNKEQIEDFFRRQLENWELSRNNYEALENIENKEFDINGSKIKIQFNPARIASSVAKTDERSISERKCFLCSQNRPVEQEAIPWGEYEILVNPFPIFPEHFTIPACTHTNQLILNRFGDMLDLAKEMSGYTVFYNGPGCGASAPDHAHFQAGSKGFMPIEQDIKTLDKEVIIKTEVSVMYALRNCLRNAFLIESTEKEDLRNLFTKLYNLLDLKADDKEPMMNILAMYEKKSWTVIVFPREKHRPDVYFAEGEEKLLISPGAVDLGGVFIIPLKKDFDKITNRDIENSLKEVCISDEKFDMLISGLSDKNVPLVEVGILWRNEINFSLSGDYFYSKTVVTGENKVVFVDGMICWNGQYYTELLFKPKDEASSFTLENVVIGINFHWERKENQRFRGALKLIVENNMITAINIIGVEDYLTSVISSEMSATASLELLKAHAVISRSWLLVQIAKNKMITDIKKDYSAFTETEGERIRWYDREDHVNFDVCADDHCQRYQGITRTFANLETVRRAIEETYGQVLKYGGYVCDARFHKCCGGVLEEFKSCWEDVDYPYLTKVGDNENSLEIPDLTQEQEADKWIRSAPEAFCNTHDERILSQVLNNYDQETINFYRWQVSYSQTELSDLIRERSRIDFGIVQELIPMQRGVSGRLVKLKVEGSKKTMIIGKELEIRRILSTSHLYSSAFVIDKKDDRFILTGAGWGHGVGLCQIGAAVMGEKGYSYKEILLHYYVNAEIERLY